MELQMGTNPPVLVGKTEKCIKTLYFRTFYASFKFKQPSLKGTGPRSGRFLVPNPHMLTYDM